MNNTNRRLRHRRIKLSECERGNVNEYVRLNGSGSVVAKTGPVTIGKWTCYFPLTGFSGTITIGSVGTAIRYLGAEEDAESACIGASVAFKRAMRNVSAQVCQMIEALEERDARGVLDQIVEFNSTNRCA